MDRGPGLVGDHVLTASAAGPQTWPFPPDQARRHRSYPRVVRPARHNSYRVKRPGDTGIRYHGPPTIRLVNLPATVMINLG
jgi:hypothetical protein